MKLHSRLRRNARNEALGAALHAVMCGAGHHLRVIMSTLWLYFARLRLSMQAVIAVQIAIPASRQPGWVETGIVEG